MASPVLLLVLLAAAAAAAPQLCSAVDPVSTYCAKNFTGAQTQASISQVLSALVPRASADYYATATAGRGDSAIWGLAQCRGDIPASDCVLCISAAARALASTCRGQADARIWYDYCFMRYDDTDFLGLPDTGYTIILINTMNASDPVAFDRAERKLMARVAAEAGEAASGGLARETARFDATSTTIYGLGWCTRDITTADCGLCVAQAVAELPNYCRFRRGCRVLYSSCMARYETYPFFFPVDGKDGGAAASSHAGEYEKIVLNP
ncbi:cysteine-rich repeat secretory protein 55-like [Phragmites australis]|uniref:cysteine-rich repeat secretory protein 55-like n=1 Tax=Phragmites australis TaxID=29695 RepID=UPI002D77181B|nr:cysteine-rich repeat secretory protein 55-like [Phragmites australis]